MQLHLAWRIDLHQWKSIQVSIYLKSWGQNFWICHNRQNLLYKVSAELTHLSLLFLYFNKFQVKCYVVVLEDTSTPLPSPKKTQNNPVLKIMH